MLGNTHEKSNRSQLLLTSADTLADTVNPPAAALPRRTASLTVFEPPQKTRVPANVHSRAYCVCDRSPASKEPHCTVGGDDATAHITLSCSSLSPLYPPRASLTAPGDRVASPAMASHWLNRSYRGLTDRLDEFKGSDLAVKGHAPSCRYF